MKFNPNKLYHFKLDGFIPYSYRRLGITFKCQINNRVFYYRPRTSNLVQTTNNLFSPNIHDDKHSQFDNLCIVSTKYSDRQLEVSYYDVGANIIHEGYKNPVVNGPTVVTETIRKSSRSIHLFGTPRNASIVVFNPEKEFDYLDALKLASVPTIYEINNLLNLEARNKLEKKEEYKLNLKRLNQLRYLKSLFHTTKIDTQYSLETQLTFNKINESYYAYFPIIDHKGTLNHLYYQDITIGGFTNIYFIEITEAGFSYKPFTFINSTSGFVDGKIVHVHRNIIGKHKLYYSNVLCLSNEIDKEDIETILYTYTYYIINNSIAFLEKRLNLVDDKYTMLVDFLMRLTS